MRKVCVMVAVLFFAGCGTSHGPVLYPNTQLKQAGEVQAQRDIDDCSRQAEKYVKDNPSARVVGGTIVGGAGGAVVGGAAGAVTGNLGRGAGIGAAAGAAAGLFWGIVQAPRPSPVYKAFVNKCLKDKGYEPIGWNE